MKSERGDERAKQRMCDAIIAADRAHVHCSVGNGTMAHALADFVNTP